MLVLSCSVAIGFLSTLLPQTIAATETEGKIGWGSGRLSRCVPLVRAEESPVVEKQFQRIERPAMAEERERHAAVRRLVEQEFPPAEGAGRPESPPASPPG